MSTDYQAIQDDSDEVESQSFNKFKYIIFSIISLPFLIYLFIILPAQQTTRIELPKLSKYADLPSHLSLMSNKKHHDDSAVKRLILIGDVHGSYDPLRSLLSKANYTSHSDQVILLGDYLSKGPDSIKVLDYALEEKFTGVLGNHELSILAKYAGVRSVVFQDNDLYNLTIRPDSRKFDKEFNIARRLTPDHIDFITSMPLILNLGPVPVQNSKKNKWLAPFNGIATHLGLDYNRPLENQNVMGLLHIEKDWYKGYNEYEKTINKKDRNIVYYGHHAGVGLNLNKYTKGLDSGCVYGGELSAMVISTEIQGKEVVYKEELVSIKC